jgi:hypothetical protein
MRVTLRVGLLFLLACGDADDQRPVEHPGEPVTRLHSDHSDTAPRSGLRFDEAEVIV